jgi:hypothetical protein
LLSSDTLYVTAKNSASSDSPLLSIAAFPFGGILPLHQNKQPVPDILYAVERCVEISMAVPLPAFSRQRLLSVLMACGIQAPPWLAYQQHFSALSGGAA